MQTMPPVSKAETKSSAIFDVGARVKTWGKRGIVCGGTAGFMLGVVFVAIPFSSHVLSFGILGTLTVVTVEGAFIAGTFGAFAALIYGKGMLQCIEFDRTQARGRRSTVACKPMTRGRAPDWLPHRQISETAAAQLKSETAASEHTVKQMLENARRSLRTIDSWENGNTGP